VLQENNCCETKKTVYVEPAIVMANDAKGISMKIQDWNGEPISAPGIYRNVSIEKYHSGKLCVGPSISSSGLRTIFAESEAHFYDTWPLNPDRAPPKEAAHFSLGRAVHHALLGEAFFTETFVVRPEEIFDPKEDKGNGKVVPWNGNRAVCKNWMAEAQGLGKTVLTPADLEKIKGIALSLGKEPMVRAGALNGHIECTMAWPDAETGVWLLARPDVIPTDSGDFVDIKTSSSVLYNDMVRTIGDYGYHQQGALIAEGYKVLTGRDISTFSLYFVESSRPHCARMVQLKDHDLLLGRQQNRNALRRFVEALNSGVWPGPGGRQDSVQFIEISEYARKAVEGRLRFEGTD
jgi:hypothetical protein